MSFTVAIVGRPNVGKSTLFNRLVGKRLALVDDLPGVTRDRREGQGRIGDLDFTAIDTAGLESAAPESLAGRMVEQTKGAALLHGARGRRAGDVGALVDAIMKVQRLALDHADLIDELDINPLVVTAEGATALDAMISCR